MPQGTYPLIPAPSYYNINLIVIVEGVKMLKNFFYRPVKQKQDISFHRGAGWIVNKFFSPGPSTGYGA
jgi:hypothetical protein